MIRQLSCFKTYDVRGLVGSEINEDVAYRIGFATAKQLKAKKIVIGYDARESSPILFNAVTKGVCAYGATVLRLGLAGTEEVYFAVANFKADAGIGITASHNPIEYNGLKIVKSNSRPLSEAEFRGVKFIASQCFPANLSYSVKIVDKEFESRRLYANKLLSFLDLKKLKPLKIVLNSGNGAAGPVIDVIEKTLKKNGVKFEFIKVCHEPDPSFPHGIPNPLLEENRSLTGSKVKQERADLGVAFDGDFDRCFVFDHLGNFVSSEYLVGILAEVFLRKERGAKIVHDKRVIWNIRNIVKDCGGHPIASKAGHTFFKAALSEAGAIYGGETSGHHYFRDFFLVIVVCCLGL